MDMQLMDTQPLAHVTTGAVIVYFVQWMKRTQLIPWLTMETGTLNRLTSGLLAAIAAIGINWTYNAGADGGTLIITGLSAWSVLSAFWEWIQQFIVQQLIFDGVIAPKQARNGK